MNILHSCRCCLSCPPDKELSAPYVHLGKIEVYVVMLKDCFDLELTLNGRGSDGICWACVGRLRDASNFKLQVQRSQEELRQASLLVEVKAEPEIETEAIDIPEDDTTLNMYMEPEVKIEVIDNTELPEDDTTLNIYSPRSPELTVNRPTRVYAKNKGGITMEAEVEEQSLLIPREMEKDAEDDAHDSLSETEVEKSEMTRPTPTSVSTEEPLPGIYFMELERLNSDEGQTTSDRQEKPYACEHCSKSYKRKSMLRQHIKHSHFLPGVSTQLVCGVCGFTFQTKLLLIEHENNEHGFTKVMCADCEHTTCSKERLENHLKKHTSGKLYRCNHCRYTARHRGNLNNHLMIHRDEKPFCCSKCNYKCRSAIGLTQHMMTHSGEKPYKCDSCDYKCRHRANLRRHRMKHTKEKPFKCNLCDYKCNRKESLQKHQRTHTGEKPYACKHCNIRCGDKSNLRRHELTHYETK